MKVVYEIERLSTNGGIERILTYRMNYMAEEWGWDIIVITLLEKDVPPHYPLSSKVKVIGLDIKRGGLLMCAEAIWKLNKVVRQLNPDIYVTFQTIGALSCLFRSHKTKTIYEAHGARKYANHPLSQYVAEWFADVITVLTKRQKEDFPKAKRVEVISNFTLLKPVAQPDYNSKIIVAAGRESYQKNFERLEKLWNKLSDAYPDWQLKIHHETRDMAVAYQEGSLLVMTSRFEGLPMVLIEAMVCGLPIIAFDCPYGPCDIIEESKTGYLIPYDDDEMFIEKLSYLMEHPEVREEMGRAAQESVKRFSFETIMAKWKKLYEEVTRC